MLEDAEPSVIVTRRVGDRIELRVSDSGPGVPLEIQNRVFEPFFTTKKEGKGTGLGLSLCYGIVHEHGGNIRLESQPGRGASFVIDMPVIQEPTEDDQPGPSASPRPHSGLRVLVVDDEPSVQGFMVELLSTMGHRVDTASALFPRKVNGHYAMLSRQDNENIYLMYSDNIHFWYSPQLLLKPTFPWEFVQLGNCGSPIETEAGWLVLSHGVGPMRKYCIGAFLLDLKDPAKVLGRLREPLLKPTEQEREGYVPNVVYSCGALLHKRELILPYAMSDYATNFATISLDEILAGME